MKNLITLRHLDSNPFSIFDDLEREVGWLTTPTFSKALKGLSTLRGSYALSCDLLEKDTHYLMNIDIPGIPEKEIKIEVRDGQIKVSGERKYETGEGDYVERTHGRFERTMTLPQDVDEDHIQAHYENGVLSIALPKGEKTLPKTIAIGKGKKEGFLK